jgi:hypothetical protein
VKKSQKKRPKKLSGLKSQINPAKELISEIISKLRYGHSESLTVALLGSMEKLGLDHNDLLARKAENDARLAAGEYVLQEPLDALDRE